MNILYIVPTKFGVMGAQASFMFPNIISTTDKHQVTVCCLNGIKKDLPNDVSFSIVDLENTRSFISKLLLIRKIIKNRRPDIVHVFFRRFSFLYPMIMKLTNIASSPQWILDIRSPLINSGLKRLIGKLVGSLEQIGFDHIISPVNETIRNVIPILWKSNSLVSIGYKEDLINKTDINCEKPNGSKLKSVYIGSLDEQRKIDKLIEAFAEIQKKKRSYQEVILDIYGKGRAIQNLKRLIKKHKLQNIVRIRGFIEQERLYKKLINYDIGLAYVPNEIYESSPALKTIEFLASGLVVVASNTKGNNIYIEHNVNGFLVKNDPESIASQILELFEYKPKKIKKIRNNGINSVKDSSWRSIVEYHLLPVYKNLT